MAILPASVTGSGLSAETPAAAIAALAPGAGGGAPGAGTPTPSPSAPASAPAGAQTKAAAKPKASTSKATTKAGTPKPRATSATTRAVTGLAAEETEVIRLVNVERRAAGCGTVALNTRLRTAMRLHVKELGTHGNLYISHVSDDGRSFTDRAREQGYNDAGGENVARGQRNAAAVMDSWMNSSGHRANILNCSFEAIGVGAVRGVDGTIVWGQIFGR
ncbi:CAP domain-containing protein [Paractinoplanes rishiriensis]|uniref:SCP domain-containing protein n=1 Tax=Paractinoplanes rishiriensis TaxID=1050105 RepID=A0A919JRT2_9ACTN|nr:CAP domain-containing protein [Actinoplanes rishiriensis]GIE93675.1 hypothetical protein Ari01nite_11400 [Actinoplanes rishiriensis]